MSRREQPTATLREFEVVPWYIPPAIIALVTKAILLYFAFG